MAVPFDLSKTPTRVLTCTGLVAAGAAATALCPPGLGVSLAAILGGIGQSFLASDIDRQLCARLNARDILRNADLQRLAGRAIRLVIEAAVEEEPARFPKQKSAIRKLARKIPEQWLLILKSPSWRVGLEQADVGQVPGLLTSYDEGVRRVETLESDTWLAALQAMADEIKPGRVTNESLEFLAGRLQHQYATAVQGLLTKDQPAFVALQMIFFKTILDRLPEASSVQASGDGVEPQAVLDTLKKLHDRSLQVQREWLKKLDKAARQRHAELLHSTERSLSALGDSVDALQAGIQQLLDGQKKIQNVAGETLDVAVETRDGVRQLLEHGRSRSTSPADGLPLGLESLPFSRNPNFSGRTEKLTELERALEASREVAVVQAQAIYGQGGIGKTQLVVEFIYRHLDRFNLVWWVPTETATTGLSSLASLAKVLDLPEQDQADLDIAVNAVKAELARRSGWLLVFDNVPHPSDADALLPPGGKGHVLITSRDTNWQGRATGLKLDVFSPEESIAYLRDTTLGRDASPTSEWETVARDLSKELGHLPLALAQAAAYVAATGISLADYLRLFHERRQELWADHEPPAGYERTVAETFALSLDQVRAESSDAEDVLNLCAFLAPDAIPRELLQSHFGDELTLNKALKALSRYSLADIEPTQLSVHRLLQTVCRDRLAPEWSQHLAEAALRLVATLLPPGDISTMPETWPIYERLFLHGLMVVRYWEGTDCTEQIANAAGFTLNQIGLYQKSRAQLAAAKHSLERAVVIVESTYGTKHPVVAISVSNLAVLLQDTGRLAEAEPLMRRVLTINEQFYGSEHHYVAISLNVLSNLLQATNRLQEAEPLMRRVLTIGERSCGATHPDVAVWLNNLAQLLQATDRFEFAESLTRHALIIGERSWGAAHPEVAVWLNNLGRLLHVANRLVVAEPFISRSLTIVEKAYDAEHPYVANCLSNLAELLQATNRLAEAEPLIRRALVICQASLGVDHPKSQSVARYLAALQNEMSDDERELAASWSVDDALRRLDEQYRAEGRPAIYFLPADQPISPHLDELLGPCASVEETLAELDRQYERDNKPPIWFLPLDEPISPHLDALLGLIDQAPGQSEEQPGRD